MQVAPRFSGIFYHIPLQTERTPVGVTYQQLEDKAFEMVTDTAAMVQALYGDDVFDHVNVVLKSWDETQQLWIDSEWRGMPGGRINKDHFVGPADPQEGFQDHHGVLFSFSQDKFTNNQAPGAIPHATVSIAGVGKNFRYFDIPEVDEAFGNWIQQTAPGTPVQYLHLTQLFLPWEQQIEHCKKIQTVQPKSE